MALDSAEDHYARRAAFAAGVAREVRARWARVSVGDVGRRRREVPSVARLVAAGQYAAARDADGYVTAALAEQGAAVSPVAPVRPSAFVGMANGPVPVVDLLDLPRVRVLEDIGAGKDPAASLVMQGDRVASYAASLVQDAGRQADSVAIVTRPGVGWVRMVNPPCCERCAVLAGKRFRSNEGFQRHPNCDCTHIPVAEDSPGDVGTDAAALFASGQVRGLNKAESAAIGDGADPVQVVNARRGRSGDKMTTLAGTTRRGRGNQARRASGLRTANARATPDGIYRYARDRDEALVLLRQNGYIL